MRFLVSIVFLVFLSLFSFSCSKNGAVSPREAFERLVNSIENSDATMFTTIQSKNNIKFFEDMAGTLSDNNISQRNYMNKRYGISKDFPADANVDSDSSINSIIEFYLFVEKNGNLLKSLKSGVASIDRTDNRAIIVTNSGAQVVFVKENSYWKVDLKSL